LVGFRALAGKEGGGGVGGDAAGVVLGGSERGEADGSSPEQPASSNALATMPTSQPSLATLDPLRPKQPEVPGQNSRIQTETTPM
jgi:hypothetical protein